MSRKVGRTIAILIIIAILSILAQYAICCKAILQHESVTYATDKIGVYYVDRMQIVSSSYVSPANATIHIIMDTETGICYMVNEAGGITPLLNQDGTPYVANGWRDDG